MKKLLVCIAVVAASLVAPAQNGTTNQDPMNQNSSTNTVTPGGGSLNQGQNSSQTQNQQNNTVSNDKALINQAPTEITTRFNSDFPGNNDVTWKQEGKNYRATYTDPMTNLQKIVVYDQDGNIIRRESQVDDIESPQGISSYYSKNYPGEKFQVWQNEDGTGNTSFRTSHNGDDLWFDQDGNYQNNNNRKSSSTLPPKSYNTQSSGGKGNSGSSDEMNSNSGNTYKKSSGQGQGNQKSTSTLPPKSYNTKSGVKGGSQGEKKSGTSKGQGKSSGSKKSSYDKSSGKQDNIDENDLDQPDMHSPKSDHNDKVKSGGSSQMDQNRPKDSDEDLRDDAGVPK